MKDRLIQLAILAMVLAGLVNFGIADEAVLPLAGTWKFQLDADDAGVKEKWYAQELADTIKLPGTTDENKKGVFKDEKCIDLLSRVWYWKGPAWYQRQVTIPESWAGKRITLIFERSKNTRVWVDEVFCGWEDTLSAAQVFDVTKAMTPGEHTITVVVDNAKMPPVGTSHAVDERTQTNWNEIIGKMELRATEPAWIEDIQVYPNGTKKEVRVSVEIGNITGKAFVGKMSVACESYNVANPAAFTRKVIKVKGNTKENAVEFTYKPGDDVPLWDEFNPAMLRLTLTLDVKSDSGQFTDEKLASFGMRDFTRNRNRLLINGKSVFLRGRVDCCNYPLTGYAPMDKAEWKRILSITKEWGINHYRFHSWCPPRAAFEAADELGVYFQAEFPNKRSGFNAPESDEAAYWNVDRHYVETTETKVSLYDYAIRESDLIFKQFGNHPSFVMYTLGNELGRNPAMYELVAKFKKDDPRRLYAQGSNNVHWNPPGTLVYNGIWYYGTYCLGPGASYSHEGFRYNWPNLGPMPGFQISYDLGKTWVDSPHTADKPLFPEPTEFMRPVKIGAPHFVDFGKNMEHSPDGKAYLLGMGAEVNDSQPRPCISPGEHGTVYKINDVCKGRVHLGMRPGEAKSEFKESYEKTFKQVNGKNFDHGNLSCITADQVYLTRVTLSPKTINDLKAYEFFAGHDKKGKPVWTNDFVKIKPLIEWNNNMGCVTATYVPALKKYLMCITDGWPTVAKMDSIYSKQIRLQARGGWLFI